jgi:ribonuclease D
MARGGTNNKTLAQVDTRELVESAGFVYVEDRQTMKEAIRELATAPSLALDIETAFASGDGVHNGNISLVQLGIDEDCQYVFDMYALHDPRDYKPMLSLLRRNDQRHVVHHAIFEQPWLWYGYAVRIGYLFDTEEAAILLRKVEDPKAPVNLASVLKRELGVEMSKEMQTSHWGDRPLTWQQKVYAAIDVAHLNRLADLQEARLREYGLWDEFRAKCDARYEKTLASIHKMNRYDDDDYARVSAMVARARSIRELRQIGSELPTFVLAHHHRGAILHELEAAIAKRQR